MSSTLDTVQSTTETPKPPEGRWMIVECDECGSPLTPAEASVERQGRRLCFGCSNGGEDEPSDPDDQEDDGRVSSFDNPCAGCGAASGEDCKPGCGSDLPEQLAAARLEAELAGDGGVSAWEPGAKACAVCNDPKCDGCIPF